MFFRSPQVHRVIALWCFRFQPPTESGAAADCERYENGDGGGVRSGEIRIPLLLFPTADQGLGRPQWAAAVWAQMGAGVIQ